MLRAAVLGAVAIAGLAIVGSATADRKHPVPKGKSAKTSEGWVVRVMKTDRDAWPEIHAENEFNDPPKPGQKMVMVTIRATWMGKEETGSPIMLVALLKSVGRSNVGYSASNSCGVLPGSLTEHDDVFKRGTITGTVCWQVRARDTRSLVMYADTFITGKPVYFAL